MGVALCTRTDLYPRVDLYLHTSEKMIGGAYLFSLVYISFNNLKMSINTICNDKLKVAFLVIAILYIFSCCLTTC